MTDEQLAEIRKSVDLYDKAGMSYCPVKIETAHALLAEVKRLREEIDILAQSRQEAMAEAARLQDLVDDYSRRYD